MRLAHPAAAPCPPSRPGLTVGPGSIRIDANDVEWCCHASPHIADDDVARMRHAAEPVRVSGRVPVDGAEPREPVASAADLTRLAPKRDAEGALMAADDVRFNLSDLTPRQQDVP